MNEKYQKLNCYSALSLLKRFAQKTANVSGTKIRQFAALLIKNKYHLMDFNVLIRFYIFYRENRGNNNNKITLKINKSKINKSAQFAVVIFAVHCLSRRAYFECCDTVF